MPFNRSLILTSLSLTFFTAKARPAKIDVQTQKAYVHPATHYASSNTDPNAPPMGLRIRLKANYDISRFTGAAKVILAAFKKYGMILADNGSDWYFTGATDTRWNDTDLNQLKTVPGNAFEVVSSGAIIR
jgi:hypothetical protein